jgi:hypothetical protein
MNWVHIITTLSLKKEIGGIQQCTAVILKKEKNTQQRRTVHGYDMLDFKKILATTCT